MVKGSTCLFLKTPVGRNFLSAERVLNITGSEKFPLRQMVSDSLPLPTESPFSDYVENFLFGQKTFRRILGTIPIIPYSKIFVDP
jgi:hypothetical protein